MPRSSPLLRRSLEALEFRLGQQRLRRAAPRDERRRRESPSRRILRDPADRPACRSAAADPANGRCATPRWRPAPAPVSASISESLAVMPGCARDAMPPAAWIVSITAAAGMPRRGTKPGLPRPSRRVNASVRSTACPEATSASAIAGRPMLRVAGSAVRDQRFDVHRQTEASQPLAHFADTARSDPRAALSGTRPGWRCRDR